MTPEILVFAGRARSGLVTPRTLRRFECAGEDPRLVEPVFTGVRPLWAAVRHRPLLLSLGFELHDILSK